MKTTIKILSFTIFFISAWVSGQQKPEPTFEVAGNMVKAIYYHENGQIAQVGCFKAGKLQGEWVMFDENGTKISLGSYDKGIRTGEWFFWTTDGSKLREVSYADGKLVGVTEWKNTDKMVL
ncbi:MAG: nicotinic acid mononucleotide adenyltransferase [Bacteroidota bacterium]